MRRGLASGSTAIVLDFQDELPRLQAQPDPRLGRLRVLDDVVDGLLEREKSIVADFRRNRNCGQLRRQFRAVTQPGQREIVLRVFAGIVDEAVQRVVGGVDRPDDFVQRTGRFPRGLGNLPCVRLDLHRRFLVGFGHFAQQRHLREVRAELVVKVAGDAGAFLFQRLVLPESLQLPLQLLG